MREMKDSGIEWIGEVPVSWSVKRIKSVLCERNESNNPVKTDFILSLTNNRGIIPYADKGDVGNKSKDDISGYKIARRGDIVLNSMNVIIGSVALSNYDGCVSPVYYMLFPRNNYDDVRYYNYLFQTKELQNKLKGYGNGIMEIRMRIQMSKLNTVLLPVAPSNIQHHIADYLDSKCSKIDSIIEREQAVIEKLKEYKLSVITEAVTKGLNPNVEMKDSGVEWMGKMPLSWEIGKLSTIGKTTSGATPARNKDSEYFLEDATIRWVKTLDLNDGEVLDSSEKITLNALKNSSCSIMPVDTVCVAMYGGAGTIGKCGILRRECATNQAVCSIVCYKNMTPEYLLFQLLALRKYWMKYAVGTRKDPNISQDIVAKMQILIPPVLEQESISSYLKISCSKIDKIIDTKQSVIKKLTEYKKSLIYEVVTGKKEV